MTLCGALCIAVVALFGVSCSGSQYVPEKIVVLTFDDGNITDRTFVGPLLKEYGFGGTFFVNKSGGAFGHPEQFMTWDDVRWLHDAGFEIGNHTENHRDVRKLSKEEFAAELETIEEACVEHGIPRPTSFCYCGYRVSRDGVEVLQERGYLLARRGVAPEFPTSDHGDVGPAYDPREDHPLLIPTTGASGPNWKTIDPFVSAVNQAKDGKIVILTFHGIPTELHPWVHTDPEVFRTYMDYLHDNHFTVIALRDVARFVEGRDYPSDPFEPIDRRLRLETGNLEVRRDANGPVTFHWACDSAHGQTQSAYQVLVASSREGLEAKGADVWDSGKVSSASSSGVYGGPALEVGKKYWWKVRAWNRADETLRKRTERALDKETAGELTAEKPGAYSDPAPWRQE